MKLILSFLAATSILLTGCATTQKSKSAVADAGCGQCLLGLKEKKGCDLAVRLNGQSYFVDGFKMKQFGDPDAEGGMCNKLRKAKVQGEVVNNRFQATSFELLQR
ncbi:MAG: DUF6370 family protein [Limisphaerales bacterium]